MIALLFGTVLVNYMNYYVTQLMINSPTPLLMSVIGWHPWSICRVLSFITLGVVFAIPLVWMFNRKLVFNRRTIILMILAAVCLEVIDILLKIYLGNSWRDLLASNLSFTRDNYYGEP
jgi:membrane protein CcdC involved in cytochrome C biogenesis